MKTIYRLLAAAPLVLASAPAFADNFGAIAFSQDNGANGYSYDLGSREEAEERALQECGRHCKVVIWFKNACAALATGEGNAYGTGWASERHEAESIAMSKCHENGHGCSVARWACTTR